MRERTQQAPAVGEAGGGTLETIGSSQGGAVDAPSVPEERADTEMIGSYQGGAVDAPSVPAGRADSDPSASSTTIDQGDGEDTPEVLSGKATHKLSNWGRLPATVRGRTWDQSQRMGCEPGQWRMYSEVGDALLAAAYEWTKPRSFNKKTSWNTEGELTMVAGGPAQTKGEVSVCMPSGFPEYVEPLRQS